MKVFISADMEGITSTMVREECLSSGRFYRDFKEQMTNEVLAACEGAIDAGAKEIVVKDAHDEGANIDITKMPECVKLIRGWSGHPYSMVEGIDSSFDAAMFVGYHSAAAKDGNPLSHTMSRNPFYMKINGELACEFTLFSYVAAREGVPTVFLSGDKMLCEDSKKLHPGLLSVAVKEGVGSSVVCLSPQKSLPLIKDTAAKSLKQDLQKAKINLPEEFHVEICFKEHGHAKKMSYYPGIHLIDSNTLEFNTQDYFEVLRMIRFVL